MLVVCEGRVRWVYLQCVFGDVVHLPVALGHCEQVVYVHEFVNLDLVGQSCKIQIFFM